METEPKKRDGEKQEWRERRSRDLLLFLLILLLGLACLLGASHVAVRPYRLFEVQAGLHFDVRISPTIAVEGIPPVALEVETRIAQDYERFISHGNTT
ncbi:MAG TPA: hypothetical protein ENF52_04850, partial [Chloroflexi bacterium]|nr:hypothetical protein [Chloroflexota bacterium]